MNRFPPNKSVRVALLLCLLPISLLAGCQRDNAPPDSKPLNVKQGLPQQKPRAEVPAKKRQGTDKKQVDAAIQAGFQWLREQQAAEGGWHSRVYGNLKGGAAVTALAMYTIRGLPTFAFENNARPALHKASDFLAPGLKKKGFVVCPDGSMDEPTYATALYLLALRSQFLDAPAGTPVAILGVSVATQQKMEAFLLQEQCAAAKGFAADDPNYGAWDLAGGSGLRGETPGTNISITRFVTQALNTRPPRSRFSSAEKEALLAWTARVQNLPGDGGFCFHPETDHVGNKAKWSDGEQRQHARSYGTATCDGVLLLTALGVPPDDPRMRAALGWLLEHPAVDHVPGFEEAPPELDWQHGLHFYYLMTLAETLPFFPAEQQTARRSAILEQLLSQQQADGSWRNPSTRMREDDPLIATCFALRALSAAH